MSTVIPVLKTPEVAEVIDRAAEPGQARLVLTRLLDAHPELAERLASDRLFVSALVALIDASRSLSEAVIAHARLLAPPHRPPHPAAEWPPGPATPKVPPAAGGGGARRRPGPRPAPLEAPAAAAHRRPGSAGPGRAAGGGPGAGLAGRRLPPGGAAPRRGGHRRRPPRRDRHGQAGRRGTQLFERRRRPL